MSEQRLIEANALARELLSITYLGCDGGYYKGRADERDDILRRIKDAPTIDAAPVVHGRWLRFRVNPAAINFKCSECGDVSILGIEKYCPNCGAKMDLEDTP